jgi:hypothetical protein
MQGKPSVIITNSLSAVPQHPQNCNTSSAEIKSSIFSSEQLIYDIAISTKLLLVLVNVTQLQAIVVVVVVVGEAVVVLVVEVLVELELVVVVVHSSVSITTIFGDTLRVTDVLMQILDSPCKTIVCGSLVLQLPIKNDSATVAVLYNINDLQPTIAVVVVVIVGFATTSISQGSSKQRSGSLHLLTQPAVIRITLLAIIATEYSCT